MLSHLCWNPVLFHLNFIKYDAFQVRIFIIDFFRKHLWFICFLKPEVQFRDFGKNLDTAILMLVTFITFGVRTMHVSIVKFKNIYIYSVPIYFQDQILVQLSVAKIIILHDLWTPVIVTLHVYFCFHLFHFSTLSHLTAYIFVSTFICSGHALPVLSFSVRERSKARAYHTLKMQLTKNFFTSQAMPKKKLDTSQVEKRKDKNTSTEQSRAGDPIIKCAKVESRQVER